MNRTDFLPNEINTFIESLIGKEALSEQFSMGNDLFKVKGSSIRGMGEREVMILVFNQVNEAN
jgi:hypothetical protein